MDQDILKIFGVAVVRKTIQDKSLKALYVMVKSLHDEAHKAITPQHAGNRSFFQNVHSDSPDMRIKY